MVKLSEQDKRLLFLLQLRARDAVPALAAVLEESEHATRRRLSRLSKTLELRTMPILNLSRLGYSRYEVLFSNTKSLQKNKKQLFQAIAQDPKTLFLAEVGGDYQAMIGMIARSPSEVKNYLRSFSNRFKGAFSEHEVLCIIGYSLIGTKVLAPDLPRQKPIEWQESDERISVDEASKQILYYYCNKSVRSVTELARLVKMPPSTVSYKLASMEQAGLIEGYFDAFDPVDLGLFPFNLFISFRGMTDELESQLVKFAHKRPEVDMIVRYVGRFDCTLLCFVKGAREISPIVDALNEQFGEALGDVTVMPQFHTYCWTEYNIKQDTR